jgi:hypothetical protein
MTTSTTRLTDDLLRRALAELADGPDASLLLTEVLRHVEAAPQVARRPWDTRGWGRAGVLVVAALLLVGAIGAAVVLSGPRPDPQPIPTPDPQEPISVPGFVQPFTYRLPPGETLRLEPRGPEPPLVLAAEGGNRVLEIFSIRGSVGGCGDAASLDETGLNPARFMDGLRGMLGDGMGPERLTTLGNLPAMAADVDLAAVPCRALTFHQSGIGWSGVRLPRLLDQPSSLIVARTNYGMVGAIISARSEAAYDEWLPIARAYLDSIVFNIGARPSSWPHEDESVESP